MFWELLPFSIREKLEAPYRRDARLIVEDTVKKIKKEKISVLDAGAGDCFAKKWFDKHEYAGIDIADFGLNIVENVENLSFKDSSFDFILCLEVLEHVSNPHHALLEIRRVLKDDGLAVFSTPLLSAGYHSDFQRWSPPGLENIFTRAGFKINSILPTGGYCRMLGLQISKISYFLKKPANKIFWPFYYLFKMPVGFLFQFFIPLTLFYFDKLDKRKIETCGYITVVLKK